MKAGPGPFMGNCHLVFISALGSGYNFGWLEDTSERHFIGAFQKAHHFIPLPCCVRSRMKVSLASASILRVMPMWEAQNEGLYMLHLLQSSLTL